MGKGMSFVAGVAVGAAAVAQVAPTAAYIAVRKVGYDRKIVVKFTTVGSAAGTLGLTVPYRAGD